ncbi:DUF4215 domain-containing protein [bacterium]|nr:DUF4215 domain-containing protein [bacterium]
MKLLRYFFTLLTLLISVSAHTQETLTLCATDQLKPGCPDTSFANGAGFVAEDYDVSNPQLTASKVFIDGEKNINITGLSQGKKFLFGFFGGFHHDGIKNTNYSGTIGSLGLTLPVFPLPFFTPQDMLLLTDGTVVISGSAAGNTKKFPVLFGKRSGEINKETIKEDFQLITGAPESTNGGESITSLSVDNENRILGAGTNRQQELPDFETRKVILYRYTRDTEQKWMVDSSFGVNGYKTFDAGLNPLVMKTIVDTQGNIYISGFTTTQISDPSQDNPIAGFIIKIPVEGNATIITKAIDQQQTYFANISIDKNGNILASGYTNNQETKFNDLLISKYDSNLTETSTQILPLDSFFQPSRIIVDSQDNIIFGGFKMDSPFSNKATLIKLKFSTDANNYGFDPNFKDAGISILDFGNSQSLITDLSVDENDNIVAIGNVSSKTDTGKVGGKLLVTRVLNNLCGNGIKEGNEECDDGNTIDKDGCSASCDEENEGSSIPDHAGDGTESGNAHVGGKASGGCSLQSQTMTTSFFGFLLSSLMMGLGLGLMRLAVENKSEK